MGKSNILIRSNLYPCTGYPAESKEFIEQVEDYALIKKFSDKYPYKTQALFGDKQNEILRMGLRCVYAPKDPCWGYIKGRGVRSKCIEEECPRILSCNPGFVPSEKQEWVTPKNEAPLYGNPKTQPKYYLVDLVPDKEKDQYQVGVEEEAQEEIQKTATPIVTEPTKEEKVSNPTIQPVEEVRIGKPREKVIIGYEEDTQMAVKKKSDEDLIPIYGYADGGVQQTHSNLYSSYDDLSKVMEKSRRSKAEKTQKGKKTGEEARYEALEDRVRSKLTDVVSISGLEEYQKEIKKDQKQVFIFENDAECSYTSSMLNKFEMEHLIGKTNLDERIILLTWKDFTEELLDRTIFVSNRIMNNGVTDDTHGLWLSLEKAGTLYGLSTTGREYRYVQMSDGDGRWVCSNIRGVTHICLEPEDLDLYTIPQDGIYPVSLKYDRPQTKYDLIDTESGMILGVSNYTLMDFLEYMLQKKEIADYPVMIKDIYLHLKNTRVFFQGIGHMEFEVY